TFTKSNTTLMELAESFKYAGTVARQSGLEFEQTAAAIGVLGDAGIKASHAGTTLRMMLMNMQAPTKKQKAAWEALGISPKDASGNLKNFNTLMAELNKKSKEMSNGDFTSLFYQAFRVTAATGAMALVRHADKLQEVTDLNRNSSCRSPCGSVD
ncbi:MAG: phage tail tape measure protein, partial [Prevotella sp.]|nr:phage tail tape measure protein [Prevotella sp.]